MPAKDGVIILEVKVWLKKCQRYQRNSFCCQEAADEFPDTFKKTAQEKGYLAEQIFNANESALFWGEEIMPQKTFIVKEEK